MYEGAPMPTKAQKSANRLNAQKSTGPRTLEGKARSSQNARKHAFTASTFNVLRLEDMHEVAHLKADLVACYHPVNAQELVAIERIALAQQTLLRAARLETGLFTSCLNDAIDPLGENPIVPMTPDPHSRSRSHPSAKSQLRPRTGLPRNGPQG